LHAYRPGGFESPTAAARPKIQAEIIEAAAKFARNYPGAMAGGLAADLDSEAARKTSEAEALEIQAGVLRFEASELYRQADRACGSPTTGASAARTDARA
jgi:hypothetical protein